MNTCETEDLNEKEIKERTIHFASWDWIFGKKLDFQYELSHRFSWGEVVLQMKVKDGRIEEANVYSDAKMCIRDRYRNSGNVKLMCGREGQ